MRLGVLGICLGLAAALVGCGDGGMDGAGGGAGGGSGSAGGAPGAAGGGFVQCGAGKAYCNGACVGVGESAAGCHNIASLPIISLIADDALYYASADAAAGKLDLTTFADTPLAPEAFRHFGLALDATHAYYATVPMGSSTGIVGIDRVPRAGGTPEPVVLDLMLDSPMSRLQLLGGKLFFLTEGLIPPGPLMVVEGAATRAVVGGAEVADYVADSAHLYFIASTGVFAASIARAPLSDLEAVEMLVQDAAGAEQLALLGNDVYWLSGASLMRAPKTGGTGETIGTPLAPGGAPSAIAHFDAGAVYLWTYGEDEDSLWVYKAGAAQPTLMARVQNNFFNQPVVTSSVSKVYVARPYAIFELAK